MLAFDYDLIVLGNTPTARYGAKLGAQRGLRVGLMTQKQVPTWLDWHHLLWQQPGLPPAQAQARLAAAQNPLADYALAIAGVDILDTQATFAPGSRLRLQGETQSWSARHYLLATGTQIQPTLAAHGLTLDQLPSYWASLPEKVLMVGATPLAIAIAQSLQHQGKQVTLACRDRLLPQEEPTLTQRLQASLEAEGLDIYTHAPVIQRQDIDGQQWLQVGNAALMSDRVIWAEPTVPHDAGLNLAALGLKTGNRIRVNAHLRTAHPQVYACGSLLGGYDLPELHRAEAAIAIANLSERRPRSVAYHAVPWCLPTQPPLARVGFTFAQAQAHLGAGVQLHTFHRGAAVQTLLTGHSPGWGCVVTHPDGSLVGASLWFVGAGEWLGLMAVAIAQKLTWQQFHRSLDPLEPSLLLPHE